MRREGKQRYNAPTEYDAVRGSNLGAFRVRIPVSPQK